MLEEHARHQPPTLRQQQQPEGPAQNRPPTWHQQQPEEHAQNQPPTLRQQQEQEEPAQNRPPTLHQQQPEEHAQKPATRLASAAATRGACAELATHLATHFASAASSGGANSGAAQFRPPSLCLSPRRLAWSKLGWHQHGADHASGCSSSHVGIASGSSGHCLTASLPILHEDEAQRRQLLLLRLLLRDRVNLHTSALAGAACT